VRTDPAGCTAGTLRSDGTQALVRTEGSAATVAMMTRGTFVTVAGRPVVRSTVAANVSWRAAAAGAVVEAEPAYKAAGIPSDTLTIGGLTAGTNYWATVDGVSAGTILADTSRSVRLAVALPTRVVVRLLDVSGVVRPGHAVQLGGVRVASRRSAVEFRLADARAGRVAVTVHDLAGRTVWRWESGSEGRAPLRVVWDGSRLVSPGPYVASVVCDGTCWIVPVLLTE
jgi:hypothetical protein